MTRIIEGKRVINIKEMIVKSGKVDESKVDKS